MRSIRISAWFLLASAGAAVAQQNRSDELLRRAVEAQQGRNFAAAAEDYRAFLRVRPDDVRALSNLGVVLVNLGRYEEAIAEYQAAARILPDDDHIELNLALAFSKSGRLNEASQLLETLHAKNPAEQKVTLLLADCKLQRGQDKQVIDLLNPLADANNNDLAVAYMLGTALLRSGRVDEGQVFLDRILRNGDSAESRFLLGLRMFESRDYPAAVQQFALAIDANPLVPDLQAYYGRALLETGDPEAAAAAFQKELDHNPNSYTASLGLAEILTARKHFDAARPLVEHALMIRSTSPEAMECMGVVLTGLAQWDAARKYLESARTAGDTSTQLHRNLARVYSAIGRTKDAAVENQLVARASREHGIQIGDLAPDFRLPRADSSDRIALSDYRGRSPVLLVFGSYSCPNLRSAAAEIVKMHDAYGSSLPFLMVYIREAHTVESWESGRNSREGIAIAPARSETEKQGHAQLCLRKLHFEFPAVIDGLDGAVEQAFSAWPSRAVLVGVDGRIVFTTRLTELDFVPAEMRSAIDRALQGAASPLQATERSNR
jgi:tetratricopeptide (TPR) repeat protein